VTPAAPDFAAIRTREFPIIAAGSYLNNAARGPMPRAHVAAAEGLLHDMSERMSPGDSAVLIDATRARAARLLNCGVEDLALLATTSQGVNLVPGGLDWRTGDEVVLYEMDHPTDIYAWLNLADRGVTVRFVKDRGGRYEAEDVERLIGPRTRAVCLSLVNYGHGFRAPIEAIGEICRRRGVWLVVDAIMALGALRVDAPAIGADIVSAHGYKFLLSGFGVAICYCSARARNELRVAEVGYKAMEGAMEYANHQPDFAAMAGRQPAFAATARRFEAGTQALAMVAGMQATLDLMLSVGVEAIEHRVLGLAGQVVEGVLEKGYRVAGSTRPGERSAIVSFTREGLDVGELSRRLTAQRIYHHVLHQRIRLSPHFYNNADDVQAAMAAL
jgi:cysteine desulfurase / selenocysteine lyase